MSKYYSPSSGGFYCRDIHEHIPADAVEISDEEWRGLLRAQSSGMVIQPDRNTGFPIADSAETPQ